MIRLADMPDRTTRPTAKRDGSRLRIYTQSCKVLCGLRTVKETFEAPDGNPDLDLELAAARYIGGGGVGVVGAGLKRREIFGQMSHIKGHRVPAKSGSQLAAT